MNKKKRLLNKEIDSTKKYSLKDAIALSKKYSSKKFDESLDICLKLGIDPKKSDQAIRGVLSLPKMKAKDIKIAVFADGDDAEKAKKAGADIVGSDDLIDEIKSGKLNFDKCISTPGMMAKVGALGQVLGPKGLMPNPKLGTVSKNLDEAIKNVKAGQLEYKSDKGGLVHASVGNISLGDEDLINNIKYFYSELIKVKPSTSKGVFVKEIFLSSTMGPGLKIDETSVIK